jgi:hypothetical protein
LTSCLSKVSLIKPFTSSSNFWQLKHDLYPHVFSKLLFHMFYNML